MDSDEELLAKWSAGDPEAGDALFRRHFESIFRFFHRRIGPDTEELVQATFLGAAEGRDRFRGEASFRTYLFAIARRQLQVYFTRRRRNERITFRTMSMLDLRGSPSTVLAASQQHERLHAALERLPVDHQLVVELYYWEGLSTREIGVALEAPQGTIKRWLWRARQQLAQTLGLEEDALGLEAPDEGS